MAWQQRMEAMKATRVDRTAVTGMIIGIIVGLALGLLIGWVWWPVEWQGTEAVEAVDVAAGTTAGGQFDTPEARYLYLGATADAYVYATAAGQSDAAAVAAQRLAALGGDIRSAFDSSVLFYRAQPGGAEQVSNLTTLAAAVGIPLGTDAADAGGTGAAAAAAGQTADQPAQADSDAQASTAEEAGSNPLQWLVSLVAALLLIGGGLYLLWLLNRRRALEGSDAGPVGFEDEEIGTGSPPIVPAFDRDSLSPMHPSVTPAASMRSAVERPVAVQGTDPHGFEPEEDDDIYPPVRRTDTMVDAETDTETDEDELLSANGSEPGNDDEWNEGDEGEDEGDEEREAEPDDVPPVRTNAPGASVRTAPPATLQAPTLQPPIPSRYERYTPIDSYTATYYLGQVDFDQGKPIGSPSGDGYLGEYSVGIPQKNGLLDHDLEKPIAMEVVLFDKSDGQSTLTTTRLLLSDYAHDHMYDEYQRANPNLAPIVARPNTRFQLEGKQLLLDCLIKDVKYTRDGFFQSVTLDLVVKRKS
jgi:hypothetical protein